VILDMPIFSRLHNGFPIVPRKKDFAELLKNDPVMIGETKRQTPPQCAQEHRSNHRRSIKSTTPSQP
jgi:hypothetical protein